MSGEILVDVNDVSKKYCRDLKRSLVYGLQDIAMEFLGRNGSEIDLRKKEFWALKDISFSLKRGECLGLIGPNGSGKSTLLRLLNGLIKPDRGEINIRGRVGALIALGAGFNPVLTGRENIYINGAVLGLSKAEIDEKLEDIIDFAGIREFIDTPVQSYSSGMKVRLGFSIATQINPEILLIDEVLAVGDAHFRSKCYNRIGEIADDTAVILVSHSMNHITHVCDRVMFLQEGNIHHLGDVSEGVQKFLESSGDDQKGSSSFTRLADPIKDADIDLDRSQVSFGEKVNLIAKIRSEKDLPTVTIRVVFYDLENKVAAEWDSKRLSENFSLSEGKSTLRINLGPLYLKSGEYAVSFVVNDSTGVRLVVKSHKEQRIKIEGRSEGGTSYQLPPNEGNLLVDN